MNEETKKKLREENILVGDVKFGYYVKPTPFLLKKFLRELQNLMLKYGISKIDVGFDIFQLLDKKPQITFNQN